MYTIPKQLIAEWNLVKKDVVKAPDAPIGWSPGQKAQLKKDVAKMVADFDEGLKAKMKVAATAKNDASAKKAASAVADVVNNYRKTAKAHAAKIGYLGPATTSALDAVLAKIAQHAEASMKSRPPLTAPPDLYLKFKAGLADVSKVADPQHRTAVVKASNALDLSTKGAILSVVHSMSDSDLDDHVKTLGKTIATSRKAAIDRADAGKWGPTVKGRFDAVFDQLEQRVTVLKRTLDAELAGTPK